MSFTKSKADAKRKMTILSLEQSFMFRWALGHRVWESECDQGPSTDFALHRNRAAVQVGDRFHQRQTQAGALGTARRISPIKAIENARKVFRCDSAAGILHRDFRLVPIGHDGNGDSCRRQV